MKEDAGLEKMEINGVSLPVNHYVFQAPFSGRLLYVFQAVTDDRVWKEGGESTMLVPNGWQRFQSAWAGRRNLGQRSFLMVNQGASGLDDAEDAVRDQLKDLVVLKPNPVN
jgi:hypothetical protein